MYADVNLLDAQNKIETAPDQTYNITYIDN